MASTAFASNSIRDGLVIVDRKNRRNRIITIGMRPGLDFTQGVDLLEAPDDLEKAKQLLKMPSLYDEWFTLRLHSINSAE